MTGWSARHSIEKHACHEPATGLFQGQLRFVHRRLGAALRLVGAGALVTENKEFPAASLIVGSPARVARQLGPQDIERLKGSAQGYVLNAKRFMAGLKQIA